MARLHPLLGFSYTALRSNLSELSSPYKLNFAVTLKCQSRCLTCNIWQLKPKGELSIEEIRELASKNKSFRWLALTGGEPFLRSDIVEIVHAFEETSNLYMLTLPTNSLCSSSIVIPKLKEMLERGVPHTVITVSIDGSEELHDAIRGIKGNYRKAISLFDLMHNMQDEYKNLSVVFGYTMSKFNQGRFMETFESVKNELPYVTYSDFHINIAQNSGNYYRNASEYIAVERSAAELELSNIISMRKNRGITDAIEGAFIKGMLYFVRNGKPPLRCRSLEASIFMDSFGDIYPSIMWDMKIGNVRETGYYIRPILLSEAAAHAKEMIHYGKDPLHWTSCEAYQALIGHLPSLL